MVMVGTRAVPLRVAVAIVLVMLVTPPVDGQQCTPAKYRIGTGTTRSGCPTPAIGNYYKQGRDKLTQLMPAMVLFTQQDYTAPDVTALALRTYLVSALIVLACAIVCPAQQLRSVISPFNDFQCRCNASLAESALNLRESFILGGLDKIRAYVANPTSVTNTQNMQEFLIDNLENMKDMRCQPYYRDPAPPRQMADGSACVSKITYTRDRKRVVRVQVVCPPGKCPNMQDPSPLAAASGPPPPPPPPPQPPKTG